MTDTAAAAQIRSYVARVLRLREEIAAMNADVSETYKEAVGNGFDKKTLQAIVKRAAQEPEAVQEQDALLELYWQAYTGTAVATRAGAHEAHTPHDSDGVVLDHELDPDRAPSSDATPNTSAAIPVGAESRPSAPSPDAVPPADAGTPSGQSGQALTPIPDLTDSEWITHPAAAPYREAGATAFRNGVSFRACPHGDPLTPPLSAAVNGWTVGWWIEQGASAAAQGRGTDACRSSAGTLARLAWMVGWERGQIAEAAE